MAVAGLPACSGTVDFGDEADADADADADSDTDAPLECSAPMESLCGNEGAILRGWVSLDPSVSTSTQGDLVVALTHLRLGMGSQGGYPHSGVVIDDVDLANGPVEYQMDMCQGGEMWSEENCEYNLVFILDMNGNNQQGSLLPDPGEPSARFGDVVISCNSPSPCMNDVRLDCTDGASCVTFDATAQCSCAEESCDSDISTCM
jgi:hypothetical protein